MNAYGLRCKLHGAYLLYERTSTRIVCARNVKYMVHAIACHSSRNSTDEVF